MHGARHHSYQTSEGAPHSSPYYEADVLGGRLWGGYGLGLCGHMHMDLGLGSTVC